VNEASPFEKPRFLRLWTGMVYLGVGNQLTLKLDGGGAWSRSSRRRTG
jgi:hypothetical protein